jgi:hypothetical protein
MSRSRAVRVIAVFSVLFSLGAASQLSAQVTASPSLVNFGQVAVGAATGSTQTVTFTIPSGLTLGGASVVTQGAANLDFTALASGTTCAAGVSGSCTVQVQFLPLVAGVRQGAVALTGQGGNALITVPVVGIGSGPQMAFGPGTMTTIPTSGQLYLPDGVGVDAAGNVYIGDTYNHTVRKVTPGGVISVYAGGNGAGYSGDNGPATAAQLYYPGPVRLDGAGNLYISDYGNNAIRLVTPGGIITTFAGGGSVCAQSTNNIGDGCPATSATLNGPWGTVADGAGNLYIGDANNNVIRRVGPNGIISTIAGTGAASYGGDNGPATAAQLNAPQLGALDSAGNLYFADVNNNIIRRITPGGIITTVAGRYGSAPGYSGDNGPATSAQLSYPQEVAVDGAGNLYLTDSGNYPNPSWGPGVIRKVTPAGIISTVAGNGTQGNGGDNGPATSAQMNGPWDIAVDGSGNLYIVDAYNSAIRKVDVSDAPALSFASIAYGSTSAAQDVNLLNLGNATLAVSSISTAANFSLGGSDTTCNATSQLLVPAASCVLGIEFAPMAVGSIGGSVVLTDNATPGSQMIALQGTGIPSTQTINFPNPGPQSYTVTPFTLAATATSGLQVNYAVVSGPATVGTGNTITFTGVGPVTIQASQAGNADYSAATSVSVTFTVTPAAQTINFPNPGPQYYKSPVTLAATASSGLQVSYTVTSGPATVSGSKVTFSGTGSVTVQATQTGNSDYSAATPASVTFTADNLTAVAPTMAPNPYTYSTPQTVTLSDASPGVTIYYTTDGSTPTTSSKRYTGPITVSTTTTIQAIAAGNGYGAGSSAFGLYKIVAVAPTMSPNPYTYTTPQTVTLSDASPGATIYYTTDGSTPTTSSKQYTGPITVSTTTTLQAIAAGNGYTAGSSAFGIYKIVAMAPTMSPNPYTYATPQTVTLSDATPGVTIYYTTDGSTPTTSSKQYTGPITVSTTTTLQAIAAGNGYAAGSSAFGIYKITP